jgi:hypothetical protein
MVIIGKSYPVQHHILNDSLIAGRIMSEVAICPERRTKGHSVLNNLPFDIIRYTISTLT